MEPLGARPGSYGFSCVINAVACALSSEFGSTSTTCSRYCTVAAISPVFSYLV